MKNPINPEQLNIVGQDRLEKAANTARKLLSVLSSEIKNPLSKKPVRYAVVIGGITYFAYIYFREKTPGTGDFQAGAVIDGQRLEVGGSFSTQIVLNDEGTEEIVFDPKIESDNLSDIDVDTLNEAVADAKMDSILKPPEIED